MTKLSLWDKKRGVRALILAVLLIICGQFSFFAAESEELGAGCCGCTFWPIPMMWVTSS